MPRGKMGCDLELRRLVDGQIGFLHNSTVSTIIRLVLRSLLFSFE